MKILEINSVPIGSTGKIMFDIGEKVRQEGVEVFYAFPEFDASAPRVYRDRTIIIGNKAALVNSHVLGRLTGYNDCFSFFSTRKLLNQIEYLKPDIIHLHNLHNCYLNLKMLFDFIKKKNIPVVWTLHDCWGFTGGCPYFSRIKCEKWKNGCFDCAQRNRYPKSFVDRSSQLYKMKKNNFMGVRNMTIVTPSNWLENLVKQSFLKDYITKTIHNGIDLSVFKKTPSNIRKKLNLEDKIILMGVAFQWDERKGLKTFVDLSHVIEEKYCLMLLGVDDKLKRILPKNIISIPRVTDQYELAEYYSVADIFINPTLEDNYPTTNLEAISCGTPVITFNTGGSPESVSEDVGIVVEQGDMQGLIKAIQVITNNLSTYKNACEKKASGYGRDDMCSKYLELLLKR